MKDNLVTLLFYNYPLAVLLTYDSLKSAAILLASACLCPSSNLGTPCHRQHLSSICFVTPCLRQHVSSPCFVTPCQRQHMSSFCFVTPCIIQGPGYRMPTTSSDQTTSGCSSQLHSSLAKLTCWRLHLGLRQVIHSSLSRLLTFHCYSWYQVIHSSLSRLLTCRCYSWYQVIHSSLSRVLTCRCHGWYQVIHSSLTRLLTCRRLRYGWRQVIHSSLSRLLTCRCHDWYQAICLSKQSCT